MPKQKLATEIDGVWFHSNQDQSHNRALCPTCGATRTGTREFVETWAREHKTVPTTSPCEDRAGLRLYGPSGSL